MPENKNKNINTSDIIDNQKKEEAPNKVGVKTYRDFAINALKDKPTSLAKMVINEKKKEEFKYKTSTKNPKNMMIILASTILVFLGIAAIAFLVVFINDKKEDVVQKEKTINPESIIYFDYKKEINATDFERRDIIKDAKDFIKNTNIPIKEIKIFYFIKKDKNGYKSLINSKEFFSKMDTRAPMQFIRNLADRFSYGVYSHIDSNKPFLVLQFLDVDSIYTNTLAWEKMMVSDIGPLFGIEKTYYSQQFSDLNLHNKDSRVILNDQGEVVFGYSFVDLNHLVFFTNSDEFGQLIKLFQNYKKK